MCSSDLYQGFPDDQRVEDMIALTQDLMDRRTTDIDQAQEDAESLLVGVIDDVNASATEVEPGVLKPDATKKTSSFVADATSHAVFSAYYRDPDMDLWEEFDDMVDDERMPRMFCDTVKSPVRLRRRMVF